MNKMTSPFGPRITTPPLPMCLRALARKNFEGKIRHGYKVNWKTRWRTNSELSFFLDMQQLCDNTNGKH